MPAGGNSFAVRTSVTFYCGIKPSGLAVAELAYTLDRFLGKTYVVLEAPVDEDVNEFGLTWSPLMNRDLGGRASDKSQIVWLPVKRRQKTDVKCPKRG